MPVGLHGAAKNAFGVESVINVPGQSGPERFHASQSRASPVHHETDPEIQPLRRNSDPSTTIHAHPELRYEETATSDLIARTLESWGIDHRGMGTTGVVGVLKNGTSSRAVGLRADMDALPITEQNSFDHRAQDDGKMHACGHDGHTAMLLAAAKHLVEHRNFDGTVVFIFQPAEEGGGGARNDQGRPVREVPDGGGVRRAQLAGHEGGPVRVTGPDHGVEQRVRIEIRGKGSHAAMPHNGIDPVFAAVQIANGSRPSSAATSGRSTPA